jgi:hypothetical protein
MSEAGELKGDVQWDKWEPGFMRWTLGPVTLRHDGRISRGGAKTRVPEGQALIILRNLFLYHPLPLPYEHFIDRLWTSAEGPPLWHMNVLKKGVSELRIVLPFVGLRIKTFTKYGWSVEFIPNWSEGCGK